MLAGVHLRNLGWRPQREGGAQRAQRLASHTPILPEEFALDVASREFVDGGHNKIYTSSILKGQLQF